MKKGIADLSFFNRLQNRSIKNRHFTFNDDIAESKPNDIEQLQSAVQDWMDEIEDMRRIDPSVEPEASAEESKLNGILKSAYERITAGTAACRVSKARLERDRPWEGESTEESAPTEEGGGEDEEGGGFGDLLGSSESEEEEE